MSLGDADCIVVTKWENSFPHRILIDGGSKADASTVIDFLRSRGYTDFWAVLCSHLHNDHVGGLINVVQSKLITIHNGWMHDIRNHVGADALRRSSSDDGVRQVVESTRELAAAFASRYITPKEPFAGQYIAGFPDMVVLGPTVPFYRGAIEEFTETNALSSVFGVSPLSLLGAPPSRPVTPLVQSPGYHSLAALLGPPPPPSNSSLFGISSLARARKRA